MDTNGLFFVPAFCGLQAPVNDPTAAAGLIGRYHFREINIVNCQLLAKEKKLIRLLVVYEVGQMTKLIQINWAMRLHFCSQIRLLLQSNGLIINFILSIQVWLPRRALWRYFALFWSRYRSAWSSSSKRWKMNRITRTLRPFSEYGWTEPS